MLGLLYDVHGNLPALEAAVDDARDRGADRFLLGGDYCLFGAWPQETVERLQALETVAWLRGNGERWTARRAEAPSDETVQGAIADCREALGGVLVRQLAALPEQAVVDGVRYCHASPISDVRSFAPAAEESDKELLAGVDERRVVFGHTHLPFRRLGPGGVELFNPGSVGMPFDGNPKAAYALVADGGELESRRVAYDHLASAHALRRAFAGAWTRTVAARIEQARFAVSG